MKTYSDILSWMYKKLPVFQKTGSSAYKPGLDRIKKLLISLKNPEKKFKSIHIAGTNGKGSTAHLLSSIIQESGCKVGLFTSPHLIDFRERIKINGKLILKKEVKNFVKKNMDFLIKNDNSFFEMTTAMAFNYFSKNKVDIAIIEVGLGGRLDATNVITPNLSIITNISLEHTEYLGETLEKIAKEKNKLVYVGFQMRFNPVVKKLKSLVENKKIGKITSVRLEVSEYMPNFHKYEDYRNSYTSRKELGGGVILSQIHELDYLQWIFGKPNSVLAYGGKISDLEIDVEDSVTALISINKKGEDGNIPISLHMDFLQKNAKRKCIVYGTKGRIEADLIKVKIDVLTDSVEKFEWKEFKRNDQFLAQIKHFLDATEKKVVPLVDLSEGKKSLEIALSLKKSLDSNKIEIIPWN